MLGHFVYLLEVGLKCIDRCGIVVSYVLTCMSACVCMYINVCACMYICGVSNISGTDEAVNGKDEGEVGEDEEDNETTESKASYNQNLHHFASLF